MNTLNHIISVDKLTSIIEKGLGQCFAIYLFGSYADNTQNESSDIDLGVFIRNKELQSLDWYETKQNLEIVMKRDIDLIDVCAVSPVLQNEILTKGKAIYVSDQDKLDEAIMQMVASYIDLMEQNKDLVEQILKDKRVYG